MKSYEELPQHIRAPSETYKLVHAITPLEENKSFLEKVELGLKLCGIKENEGFKVEKDQDVTAENKNTIPVETESPRSRNVETTWETETDCDSGYQINNQKQEHMSDCHQWNKSENKKHKDVWSEEDFQAEFEDVISVEDRERIIETQRGLMKKEGEWRDKISTDQVKIKPRNRRRRKLPQIPKNKKPLEGIRQASLFEELNTVDLNFQAENGDRNHRPPSFILVNFESLEETGDVDSGVSSSHSPEADICDQDISPSLSLAAMRIELLDPTHRGLHRFVPRHDDELEIEIGDPIYVQKEADDLWCEGINLRTGRQGIFPFPFVVDVDYNDFDPSVGEERKERYLLHYLGSVSCNTHKGSQVITQAVIKITNHQRHINKSTCVLEIGDKGIKMVSKNNIKGCAGVNIPGHDYFFSLKNVTFCGFHPRDSRYFGFITKHPSPGVQKFACHVFMSESSTRCVAEAYGRAFQRFYKTFIETAFPTEDIYLE